MILCLVGFVIYLFMTDKPNEPKLDKSSLSLKTIEIYSEGDSLFLDTLNKYKNDWEKQNDFLDNAIKLRNKINECNFDSLKNVTYSSKQESFKNAVNNVEKDQYKEVKNQLGDVSKLTLTQIATKINEIVEELKKENTTSENAEGKTQEVKKEHPKKGEAPVEKPTSAKLVPAPTNVDDAKAIEYLKGEELKKSELKNLKDKDISGDVKTSIEVALKFWEIGGVPEFNRCKTSVEKDPYLKNNPVLTKFLGKNPKTYPKNSGNSGGKLTLNDYIKNSNK